jgi:phosphoglycerate dehydrogenase-like enzyme
MKNPVILITAATETDVAQQVRRLAPGAKVFGPDELQRQPEIFEQADIIYGRLDPELFPRAGRLKWLQATSAGVEWTQRAEVLAHPAVITNARVHAGQVSEQAFGLLLMLIRRLHQAVLQQQRRQWATPPGALLSLDGRTLCILGLGVIGRQCARLGKALGMRVIGLRRSQGSIPDVDQVLPPEELHQALGQADVVINLLPGARQMAGFLGRREFEAMREGAMLINVGRGVTVDTAALLEALESGRLGGAGLDVIDPEPLPADHPLWGHPNVIITAHYAGNVGDYFRLTDRVFLENLERFLAGQPLNYVVDKRLGY